MQKRVYHGLTISQIVVRYYPDYSSHELAKMYGVTSTSICRYANKMGVAHTEETLLRLKRKTAVGSPCMRKSPATIAKMKKTIKRKIRKDKERILNGKKPLYRQALSIAPRRIREVMYWLSKKRGYFCDCSVNSFALFYDEDTVRESPSYKVGEDYYKEKYGLVFLPADDYKEDVNEKKHD